MFCSKPAIPCLSAVVAERVNVKPEKAPMSSGILSLLVEFSKARLATLLKLYCTLSLARCSSHQVQNLQVERGVLELCEFIEVSLVRCFNN